METPSGPTDEGPASGQPPPPPSPLSGAYLLILVGEPHTEAHKDDILRKIANGFLSWDMESCHVALDKELQTIIAQAPEGEEARNGERLIQFASESLVTEVLIQPQLNTLIQCVRNLLSSFTKHRHIIHAGYTFSGNGSWVVQDGTFSLADLIDAFQENEVQRVLRAYENSVTVDIHCAPEGEWSTARLRRESFTKLCRVRVNPDDSPSPAANIQQFVDYLAPFVRPASVEQLLEPSDVVGNIRFSHPTLYVFPGGQGDAALFGINGFNMLVDGGFARKACFWDFARHLDRLDAVLMTRINNSNINGVASVLRRKKISHVYPQIGHFFCNLQDRKQPTTPDEEKVRDPLLVSLLDEGQEIVQNLRHLQLKPHHCVRESVLEPINLYHKVGHGKLDMYVISPSKDSKELKEFLSKWNSNDISLFNSVTRKPGDKDISFPLQNLVSICALLVWQPANPEDTITRILFPGSTPQHKIFEGLEKLRSLDFMKQPVCTAKTLSPSSSTIGISTKVSKPKSTPAVIDKLLPGEGLTKPVSKSMPQTESLKPNVAKSATIPVSGESKPKTTPAPIQKPSKPKQEKNKPDNKTEVEKEIETDVIVPPKQDKPAIITEQMKDKDPMKLKTDKQKIEIKPKKTEPKSTSKIYERKTPKSSSAEKKDSVKSSPTTPKKSVDSKVNGVATKPEIVKSTPKVPSKTRISPSATPAKSTKEENNRKVVESKVKAAIAAKSSIGKPTRKEEIVPKAKPEKRLAKKATSSSPVKLPSKTFSPIKATSKTISKTKKDSKKLKGENEKGMVTDSSNVSTPSTIDAETAIAKEDKPDDKEKVEETTVEKELETQLDKEKIDDDTKEIDESIETKERTEEVSLSEEVPSAEKVQEKQVDVSEKEFSEKEEEDEILIIEKVEIEQDGEDSVHEQESLESHLPDEGEEEIQKLLRDEAESEKKKDETPLKEDIYDKDVQEISSVLDETQDKDDVTQDVEESKESEAKKHVDVPNDLTLNLSKEVMVDKVLTPENREQIEEEVQEIITSATDFVAKTKLEQSKESSELSAEGIGSDEQKTSGETKDLLSSPEKLNIISDRNFTDDDNKQDDTKDKSKDLGDVKYGAEESQPDEKFSTTVESGATTAPTLPEDERIPLDEIKEGVEEKYDKEETKEKDVEAPQGRVDQPTTLPQVAIIPGGAFDVQTAHMLTRDIVKTPDEVADLPVHEEVDGVYEDEEFSREGSKSKDDLLNIINGKKEQGNVVETVDMSQNQTIVLKDDLPPVVNEDIEFPKDIKADEEELNELKLIRQRLEEEDTKPDKTTDNIKSSIDNLPSKDVKDKIEERPSDIALKIRKDVDLPVEKVFLEEDLIHTTLQAPKIAELVLVTPDSAPDSPLHRIEENKERNECLSKEKDTVTDISFEHQGVKADDLTKEVLELKADNETTDNTEERKDLVKYDDEKQTVDESVDNICKDSDDDRFKITTTDSKLDKQSTELDNQVEALVQSDGENIKDTVLAKDKKVSIDIVHENKVTAETPKTPPASPVLEEMELEKSTKTILSVPDTSVKISLDNLSTQHVLQPIKEFDSISRDIEQDINGEVIAEQEQAIQTRTPLQVEEVIAKEMEVTPPSDVNNKSDTDIQDSQIRLEEKEKHSVRPIITQAADTREELEKEIISKPTDLVPTAEALEEIKSEEGVSGVSPPTSEVKNEFQTLNKEYILKDDLQKHDSPEYTEKESKTLEEKDKSPRGVSPCEEKDFKETDQNRLLEQPNITSTSTGPAQSGNEDIEHLKGKLDMTKSLSPNLLEKCDKEDIEGGVMSIEVNKEIVGSLGKDIVEEIKDAPNLIDKIGTSKHTTVGPDLSDIQTSHPVEQDTDTTVKHSVFPVSDVPHIPQDVTDQGKYNFDSSGTDTKVDAIKIDSTISMSNNVIDDGTRKEEQDNVVEDKNISAFISHGDIKKQVEDSMEVLEVEQTIPHGFIPVSSDKEDSKDLEAKASDEKKIISPFASEKDIPLLSEEKEVTPINMSHVKSDTGDVPETSLFDEETHITTRKDSPVASVKKEDKVLEVLVEEKQTTHLDSSNIPSDKDDSKILVDSCVNQDISPTSISPKMTKEDISDTDVLDVQKQTSPKSSSPVPSDKKTESKDIETLVVKDKKDTTPKSASPIPSEIEDEIDFNLLQDRKQSTPKSSSPALSDKEEINNFERKEVQDKIDTTPKSISPIPSGKEDGKDKSFLEEQKQTTLSSISPVPSDQEEVKNLESKEMGDKTTAIRSSPILSDKVGEKDVKLSEEQDQTTPKSSSPVPADEKIVSILEAKGFEEKIDSTPKTISTISSEKEDIKDLKVLEDKKQTTPSSSSPVPSDIAEIKVLETKDIGDIKDTTPINISPIITEKESANDAKLLEEQKPNTPASSSPVPADKEDVSYLETKGQEDKIETTPKSISPIQGKPEDEKDVSLLEERKQTTPKSTSPVPSDKEHVNHLETKGVENKIDITPKSISPTPSDKGDPKDVKSLEEQKQTTPISTSPVPSDKEDVVNLETKGVEDHIHSTPKSTSPIPNVKEVEDDLKLLQGIKQTTPKSSSPVPADKYEISNLETKGVEDKIYSPPKVPSPIPNVKEVEENVQLLEEPKQTTPRTCSPVAADKKEVSTLERKGLEDKLDTNTKSIISIPGEKEDDNDVQLLQEQKQITTKSTSPVPSDKEEVSNLENKDVEDKFNGTLKSTSPIQNVKEAAGDIKLLGKQGQTTAKSSSPVPADKEGDSKLATKDSEDQIDHTSKSISPAVSGKQEDVKDERLLNEQKQTTPASSSPGPADMEEVSFLERKGLEDKTDTIPKSISPIPSEKEDASKVELKDIGEIRDTTPTSISPVPSEKEDVNNSKLLEEQKQTTTKSSSPIPSDKNEDSNLEIKDIKGKIDSTPKSIKPILSETEESKDIGLLDDQRENSPKSSSPVGSDMEGTKDVEIKEIEDLKGLTPKSISPLPTEKEYLTDSDIKVLDENMQISPKSISPVPSDGNEDKSKSKSRPVPLVKDDVSDKESEELLNYDELKIKEDAKTEISDKVDFKDTEKDKSEVLDGNSEKQKMMPVTSEKDSKLLGDETTNITSKEISKVTDLEKSKEVDLENVEDFSSSGDAKHLTSSPASCEKVLLKEEDSKTLSSISEKDDSSLFVSHHSNELKSLKSLEKDEATILDEKPDTHTNLSPLSNELDNARLAEKSDDKHLDSYQVTTSFSPIQSKIDHEKSLEIPKPSEANNSENTHFEKQDTPKNTSPALSEKDSEFFLKDDIEIEEGKGKIPLVDRTQDRSSLKNGKSLDERIGDGSVIENGEEKVEALIEKSQTSVSISSDRTDTFSDELKILAGSETTTMEKADTELSEKQKSKDIKVEDVQKSLTILEKELREEDSKISINLDSSTKSENLKSLSNVIQEDVSKVYSSELDAVPDSIEKGILETLNSEKDSTESVKKVITQNEELVGSSQSRVDSSSASEDKVPTYKMDQIEANVAGLDVSNSYGIPPEENNKIHTKEKDAIASTSTVQQLLLSMDRVSVGPIDNLVSVDSTIENKDIKTEKDVKTDSDSSVPSTVLGSNVGLVEKCSLPEDDSKLQSETKKIPIENAQEIHHDEVKDGLSQSSSLISTVEITGGEPSQKSDTALSKDEYSSSVHRMLVTESSEDGGTEIELCSSSVMRMADESCDKRLGNISHQVISGEDETKHLSSSSMVTEEQSSSPPKEPEVPATEKSLITTTHLTSVEDKTGSKECDSSKQEEIPKATTTTVTKTDDDHSITIVKTTEERVAQPTIEKKETSPEEGQSVSETSKSLKTSVEAMPTCVTSHTLKKEISDAARSGTPASDMASEREFEGPSTPHSDISSGQVSRAATHVWGETSEGHPDSRHCDSDDDIPCSPMSATSHIAQSPPQFDFDIHQHSKQGFFEEATQLKEPSISSAMTSSLYGSLPEEDPLEDYKKQSRDESQMYSSMYVSKYGDDDHYDKSYSSLGTGQFESMFSSKKDDIDFETAIKEHKSTRGEDLTTKYTNGGKGITPSEKPDIDSQSDYSVASTNGHGKPHINGKSSQPDSLEYQESHSSTSTSTTTVPQKSVIGQSVVSEVPISSSSSKPPSEEKKDPIEGWGKPLGLPPPPKNLIDSPLSRSTLTLVWNPADEWGIPLGLPSPAPPPVKKDSMNGEIDTEITSTSNKTTPKKVARRNAENNKSASNTPVGKEASNKSKHPESPVKRATNKEARSKPVTPIYMDLTYVPHHGNSHYTSVEFFKRVRARYYVFSGTEPSREVFNALLEAKQTWEDKDLEVTIIPTYDTDTLGYWVAENEDILAKYKIDLSPSASRCTINLQDHETSCSAYRLEF